MVNQPILISAHFKKVVGLFDSIGRGFMIRAFSINQLPLCVEPLTPKAIQAFIFTKIDVSGIVNLLHDLLYHLDVRWIGCSDKMIVIDIQFRPKIFKKPTYFVYISSRTQILIGGGAYDFIAMFVRSG